MMQFNEVFPDFEIVASVMRQLSVLPRTDGFNRLVNSHLTATCPAT